MSTISPYSVFYSLVIATWWWARGDKKRSDWVVYLPQKSNPNICLGFPHLDSALTNFYFTMFCTSFSRAKCPSSTLFIDLNVLCVSANRTDELFFFFFLKKNTWSYVSSENLFFSPSKYFSVYLVFSIPSRLHGFFEFILGSQMAGPGPAGCIHWIFEYINFCLEQYLGRFYENFSNNFSPNITLSAPL